MTKSTLIVLSTLLLLPPLLLAGDGGTGAAPILNGAPTLADMLKNFGPSIPSLKRMVTAIAYIVGFALVVKALYGFKIYGELRVMTSSQTNIAGPIMTLVAGAMLIYFPTMVGVTTQTFYGYESPLSYESGGGDEYRQIISIVVSFVQLVGIISFLRGWLHLSRLGQQGAPQGSLGRGLTHVIAGVLALNIVGTWNVLAATFGFNPIS